MNKEGDLKDKSIVKLKKKVEAFKTTAIIKTSATQTEESSLSFTPSVPFDSNETVYEDHHPCNDCTTANSELVPAAIDDNKPLPRITMVCLVHLNGKIKP